MLGYEGLKWMKQRVWPEWPSSCQHSCTSDGMKQDFLHARYANLFRVGQNEHEMILEFGQVGPDGSSEAFHTRIVLAAGHGSALLELIAEAVADHQRRTKVVESGDELN